MKEKIKDVIKKIIIYSLKMKWFKHYLCLLSFLVGCLLLIRMLGDDSAQLVLTFALTSYIAYAVIVILKAKNINLLVLTLLYGIIFPTLSLFLAVSALGFVKSDSDMGYTIYLYSYVFMVGIFHPGLLWIKYIKKSVEIKELLYVTDKAKVAALIATAIMALVSYNLPKIPGINLFENFTDMITPVLAGYMVLRTGIEFIVYKGYKIDGNRYPKEKEITEED